MADDRMTPEDLWAMVERLEVRDVRVCGVHSPHVVHPKDLEYALEHGAWLMCGNCFQPFKVDRSDDDREVHHQGDA